MNNDAIDAFVALVAAMRAMQKNYFQTGDRTALRGARDLERRVDAALRDLRTDCRPGVLPGMEDSQ